MATKKTNTNLILALAIFVVVMGIVAYILSLYSNSYQIFESKIKTTEIQSDSTEVEEIEKDLNTTDLSDLDKELSDIEAEIETSY